MSRPTFADGVILTICVVMLAGSIAAHIAWGGWCFALGLAFNHAFTRPTRGDRR